MERPLPQARGLTGARSLYPARVSGTPLHPTRRQLAVLCGLALVSLGWYAVEPVHPDCLVLSGGYASGDAPPAERYTASQRAYEQAVSDGACGPSRPRFLTWTG